VEATGCSGKSVVEWLHLELGEGEDAHLFAGGEGGVVARQYRGVALVGSRGAEDSQELADAEMPALVTDASS
jgi:hypothetical protein